MKTRKDLYGKEAAELIRVLSAYHTLYIEQIYRLFPEKKEKLEQIITILIRQNRIYLDADYNYLYYDKSNPDFKTIQCFWVLLDFIDKVEFHLPGSYPVVISYFARQEIYEIVYIAEGEENIILYAFQTLLSDSLGKRIIVVERPEQIPNCMIPNTAGYCIVLESGEIEYYQVNREE